MTNPSVNQAVKQKSLAGIVCVTLEVHLWSGRKRLKKESLISKNPEFANLPPESLATLGSIKICDPEDLAPFLKKKRAAEKLLVNSGLPAFGTIGIPEAKLDTVFKELVRIQAEFNQLRDAFYKRFDAAIELWREQDENAEWLNLLHDIPSPEEVAGKLSFGFHLARAEAPSDNEFSEANKLYSKQMTGLKGELFSDAAREADILITKYLTGADAKGVVKKKEKVTWKTLRPLKRISEKFQSFSFLDPSCEPMARMIDHVLELLPGEGPIDGVHLMHIWSLSQALTKPSRAMAIAEMAFSAESAADAFEHLLTSGGEMQTTFADPAAIPVETTSANAELDKGLIEGQETAQQQESEALATVVPVQTGQPEYVGLF